MVKARTSKPKPIDEWPEFESGEVERSDPEWKIMWDGLAEASGDQDRAARDPISGEAWQYMCSVRFHGSQIWEHEFRHRWHPKKQARWVLLIEATPGWKYLCRPGDRCDWEGRATSGLSSRRRRIER